LVLAWIIIGKPLFPKDFTNPSPTHTPTDTLSQACKENGGTWIEDNQECEVMDSTKGLSQDRCEQLGGVFDECASPCRHDPSAEVCIQSCVQLCKL
jgi:hypothetical protein